MYQISIYVLRILILAQLHDASHYLKDIQQNIVVCVPLFSKQGVSRGRWPIGQNGKTKSGQDVWLFHNFG